MLCPVELRVWVVDRMLNFEIVGNPHYEGLELQAYPTRSMGGGWSCRSGRREEQARRHPPAARAADRPVDRRGGRGPGEWREAVIDPARLAIRPFGVNVAVALVDVDRRVIEVRIDDHNGKRRRPGTMLAPVRAAVEQPASLSLFVMAGCDLVRRGRPAFDLRISGRRVTTGRLPGGWLHRRRLVKYTADPTVVVCNPAADGPVATVDPTAPGPVELDPAGAGIAALGRPAAGTPPGWGSTRPCPTWPAVVPGETAGGRWRLGVDQDPAVVAGAWTARRRRDRAGWASRDPGLAAGGAAAAHGRPPRAAPVFRSWPTTYRWSATVDLAGDPPTVRSGWVRTTAVTTASPTGD